MEEKPEKKFMKDMLMVLGITAVVGVAMLGCFYGGLFFQYTRPHNNTITDRILQPVDSFIGLIRMIIVLVIILLFSRLLVKFLPNK